MTRINEKGLLIIICLLALCFSFSFGFTLSYFTQSSDSSTTFTAGKIDFNMEKINSSTETTTLTSDYLSQKLSYVSYEEDVINNKYNSFNYMVSYVDIQFKNISDVDINLDLTLDFVFATAQECSCVILAYTDYSNITDNYDYKAKLFTFDGVTTKTDHKAKMLTTYNLSYINDNKTLRVNLFSNSDTFKMNLTLSYRFVMLLDYDEANVTNSFESSDINSFSHSYNFNLVATLSQHHD